MRTSAPGNKRTADRVGQGGFTLLELLVVVAIIALGTGISVLALRSTERDRLDQEAVRLTALFEAARVESRSTGRMITWRPASLAGSPDRSGSAAATADFLFEGPRGPRAPSTAQAPANAGTATEGVASWPQKWLHADTRAEVLGAPRLILGPEPLIPPQRVQLRLGEQRIVLVSNGLSAFQIEETAGR